MARPVEVRRHHTDYAVVLVIQLNCLADDQRIAGEEILPRVISEQRYLIDVRLVLLRPERPPDQGLGAESLKPLRGDLGHQQPLGTLRSKVVKTFVVLGGRRK